MFVWLFVHLVVFLFFVFYKPLPENVTIDILSYTLMAIKLVFVSV